MPILASKSLNTDACFFARRVQVCSTDAADREGSSDRTDVATEDPTEDPPNRGTTQIHKEHPT